MSNFQEKVIRLEANNIKKFKSILLFTGILLSVVKQLEPSNVLCIEGAVDEFVNVIVLCVYVLHFISSSRGVKL